MSGEKINAGFISAVQWSSAILPVLNEGRSLRIPLSGSSMNPLLSGGRDEAIIASVQGKRLKRGDIVLYVRKDGTHVLHRIHHIRGESFYMLGDAHTDIEGPIEIKNVLAVAESVIRKGKTICCKRFDYRIISSLWLTVRPIRPWILRIIRNLLCIIRKVRTRQTI